MRTLPINPKQMIRSGTLLCACLATVSAGEGANDADIRNAVIDNLMKSSHIYSGNVELTVDDGEVTLTGTVDNILAKRRAERLTSMTRGVFSVDNDIMVQAADISNSQLEEDVINALLVDPAADSYEISVAADKGEICLTGKVESWQERQLAEFAAMGVYGVRQVDNQIQVEYVDERSDHEIQQDVEGSIAMDPQLRAYLLEVDVDNDEVAIEGSVGSLYEKNLLRGHAWTAGVDSVDLDEVTISWWLKDDELRQPVLLSDLSDELVQNGIEYQLGQDPFLVDDGISVTVNDGTARLYGTVDTIRDQQAAEREARGVSGVTRVRNYLVVSPSQNYSETGLKTKVGSAITRDPWLERYEIQLTVVGDSVYLYGTVDTSWEKQHAEEVAARVDGVTELHNRLQIDLDDYDNRQGAYYDYDYGYDYGYDYTDPLIEYDNIVETGMSDWEMSEDIRDELYWSPFVDENDVIVTVDDGVAILTGTVADWDEYWSARANAFDGGALRVRSSGLEVESMQN